MNIKSLLLGSAAALIAVSGARAADAVTVAEPEPAQYVKICDVYGSGYFYIPGTETCLRIGGYVRYDIGVGDREGVQNVPDRQGDGNNDTYYKQARFTLKTWTGQETELGTLKTYTETRFNFGNSSGDYLGTDSTDWQARNKGVSLNFAWIQLGGLRVGKDESAFNTFIGYAGNVIDDTIVPYGDFDTNVVQYYFDAGNGFSAVVSLEEGDGDYTIDSYVPHVAGGVKYTQGWGAITGVLGYDSNYEEVAGKVRLDMNATNELSLFVMGGYGSDSNADHNFYKLWDGNWAIWGGGTYQFNKKTSFNVQASYDEGKTFGLAANIAYDIVPGFTVTAEADYFSKGTSVYHASSDGIGGILRFQRSF
ncbi:MAG: porin [Mesorhizobium sp.]|uniref:porin n=1 Tax=unclassified Mesorhizobium TaxID=325217 RepID=UPI000F764543|nr:MULTISPECIES: porin [unclassified Mesorhizobium]TGV92917.1 porin [Mesorhizobium sp. M00.F.Ca.ET.158.01.1.1]AZO61961.1 porin [Mesorhizobium sp. M1A.F.Ca.IN.022.06.1.1]RUV26801.1 porin [Mesorhizobium sp. M1A.F.Ca.IN.022.04.1.1]RWG37515.1 MAG: porin [Mesorhizobium sp.]TGQ21589.1 porin [Mesorhizobium sp. M00.F.Ca.ET.217.01.1.1]